MSLLKKMITLSVYSTVIVLIFNFLLKLNPSLSISLNIMNRRDKGKDSEADSSLEENLLKESQIGDGYVYIPLKNMRQMRIKNIFYLFDEPVRTERITFYKNAINNKPTLYEDKEKVRKLELELLEKGLWVKCDWKSQMPPPFNDTQCTESELSFLLENSENFTDSEKEKKSNYDHEDGSMPVIKRYS